MEKGSPEVTSKISISGIADSACDASHSNKIKKEYPISEPNLHGGFVYHALGDSYTGTNVKLEMEDAVKPDITSEVSLSAIVGTKSETFFPNEIKKEFPFSEPYSHGEDVKRSVVKHEDTNNESFDIQITSEVLNLKCDTKSNNDNIYIKCEPLVSEELHIKNETRTAEKPFKCSVCDYRSAVKCNLQTHMKTHTGEKPFKCNLCNYRSIQKNDLEYHMKTHTGEKPFKCNLCDYKCIRKSKLQNHIKTHTGERPFICNVCDYKCIRKNDLQRHTITHTGEKPLKCNICDYRSRTKFDLGLHMKIHTGEKPFVCNICNYRCIRKADLQRHMIIHTDKKPFKCNICDYTCTQKCRLQRHMKSHTDENK